MWLEGSMWGRHHRGFTLIELLIVIAIILILIGIALPNFLEAQVRAKIARAKGDVRAIGQAQEAYFLDRKVYTDDCDSEMPGCLQLTTPVKYISQIPIDPFGEHANSGSPVELLFGGVFRPYYPMGTGTNPETFSKLKGNAGSPTIRDVYLIYSSGPFDKEPGSPTRTFPLEGAWTLYAATNGTNSFGGIIKVGGVRITTRSLLNLNAAR